MCSTAREQIMSGPAGTGKTLGGLYKLAWHCETYPGVRAALVRKTRASLSGTALVTLEEQVLGPEHQMVVEGPTRGGRGIYRWENGSEIVVCGIDRPARLLSSEYDLIYVVQAEEILLADWETLLTRLRHWTLPFQQIYGDCNPSFPYHWIPQRAARKKLELIATDHKDNPALWDEDEQAWTSNGEKYLATLDDLSGVRKKRLRYGQWAAPEGMIYDVYDDTRHKITGFLPPRSWPRMVGIDPVGARIAAIWLAFDPKTSVLHAFREYYEGFGKSTASHAEQILKEGQGEPVFVWVAGQKGERQARLEWQAAGIPCIAPPISSVEAGINRVYTLLERNLLVIHDTCENLLAEIGTYRHKITDDVPQEGIEDKDDYHLLDALRYIVAHLLDNEQEHTQVVYRPARIGQR